MYEYSAVVDFYDKHRAQRTIRKTVWARNKKEAAKQLDKLGRVSKISWERVPADNMEDNQLELF